MSEEEYYQMLVEKREISEKLENIKNKIEKFNYREWWHSTMCHNFEECGDECHDCDMPEEMWKDVRKEIEQRVRDEP